MVLSAEYLAFLDSLDGVLEGASTGDSVAYCETLMLMWATTARPGSA